MIGKMYITLMPVILAGTLNMIFVKTKVYERIRTPMDGGLCLKDKKRLFGDNKTWAGFGGMILFGMVAQVIWGGVCRLLPEGVNYIYQYHDNSVLFNLLVGGALGLAYVVFELPNSFVKRRIDIPDGKTVNGLKGVLFLVIDQVDSIFGVTLVTACLYPMPLWQYGLYILIGGGTHIAVNLILYATKIRRNL